MAGSIFSSSLSCSHSHQTAQSAYLTRADCSYQSPKLHVAGDTAFRSNAYTNNLHRQFRCLGKKIKAHLEKGLANVTMTTRKCLTTTTLRCHHQNTCACVSVGSKNRKASVPKTWFDFKGIQLGSLVCFSSSALC